MALLREIYVVLAVKGANENQKTLRVANGNAAQTAQWVSNFLLVDGWDVANDVIMRPTDTIYDTATKSRSSAAVATPLPPPTISPNDPLPELPRGGAGQP